MKNEYTAVFTTLSVHSGERNLEATYTKASLMLVATSRMGALGVGPFLVPSSTILICNCPCAVIATQSTPAFRNVSASSSPSSLNTSTPELIINVGGCFFACSGVMFCADASSDLRSSGDGPYNSMPLRKKGTVLKGPLKNWNSLGVSRSLVIKSVIGQMRT
jgi:hypothetical protein